MCRRTPVLINLSHCVIFRYNSSEQGENSEEEEIFTIEKLLDKRYPGPKVQYLVKWKDYGNEHNTWESKSSLPGNIVKTFEEGQWIKNQLLESEPRTNLIELSDDEEQGDVKMVGPQNEVKQNITESVQSFRKIWRSRLRPI